MPGQCAGSGVAKSSKQDSKRFNFISKTNHFAHLVILFIYCGVFKNVHSTVKLASFID